MRVVNLLSDKNPDESVLRKIGKILQKGCKWCVKIVLICISFAMVEVCVRACVKEKISNDRITRNAYEVNKSLPQKITDYITVREIIVEDTAFVYVIDVNDNVVDMSKITKLNLERYGINHTFTKMNSLFKELISTNRGLMYRINGIYSKKMFKFGSM